MRYFIELAYDGSTYHGWQIQPNAISVQEVVEDSLSKILRKKHSIVGAGRTDAGVHASQIFAHFDTDISIDITHFNHRMNRILPDSIVLINTLPVQGDAHARFDATARSYIYKIHLGKNPFLIGKVWQLRKQELDINLMNEASSILLDYTDFKCFSKSKTDVRTYNCKITEARWEFKQDNLYFYISADRFLRNMVRAIVGTMMAIGRKEISISDFHAIINSKDRRNAGFSVPPQGLYLTKVTYPNNLFI